MTIAPIAVTFGCTHEVTFDAGGLQISSVTFPPRLRLRPHVHERDCVSIVLDGWLETSFGGRRRHSRAGSVETIPADALHEDVFAPSPTRTLIVEAEPEAAEALAGYGVRLDEITYLRDSGIGAVALRIAREIEAQDPASPLVVEGLVLELLALLARRTRDERARGWPPAWLDEVRDVVHTRFAEPLSIAELAAAAGVHPAHLAREFRQHFGLPVRAYARRLRLDWAGDRLSATDESLAAIALAAGFCDQSHFTRAFKRHTGVTPARYRAGAQR